MPAKRRRRGTGFTFDTQSGRYRNERSGRFVSRQEIQRAVEAVVQKSSTRIDRLAEQLRTRAIDVTSWELAMRQEIKATHLITSMLAKGGRAQMTQADFGAVGARIQREYAYLQRFADQVVGGLPLDGRFTRRSEMYTKAGRGTFHEVGRDAQRDRGFTHERNVIHPGDSCAGCVAASAAGTVPIGTLVPVGQRDCLTNCRCTIVYSRA